MGSTASKKEAAIAAINDISITTIEDDLYESLSSFDGTHLPLTQEYELSLRFNCRSSVRGPTRFFSCRPRPKHNASNRQIHCFLGLLVRHGDSTGFIVTKRLDQSEQANEYYVMVDFLARDGVFRAKNPIWRWAVLQNCEVSLARLTNGLTEQEGRALLFDVAVFTGCKVGWAVQKGMWAHDVSEDELDEESFSELRSKIDMSRIRIERYDAQRQELEDMLPELDTRTASQFLARARYSNQRRDWDLLGARVQAPTTKTRFKEFWTIKQSLEAFQPGSGTLALSLPNETTLQLEYHLLCEGASFTLCYNDKGHL